MPRGASTSSALTGRCTKRASRHATPRWRPAGKGAAPNWGRRARWYRVDELIPRRRASLLLSMRRGHADVVAASRVEQPRRSCSRRPWHEGRRPSAGSHSSPTRRTTCGSIGDLRTVESDPVDGRLAARSCPPVRRHSAGSARHRGRPPIGDTEPRPQDRMVADALAQTARIRAGNAIVWTLGPVLHHAHRDDGALCRRRSPTSHRRLRPSQHTPR